MNAGESVLGCAGGGGVSVAEVLACFGSELGEEVVGEEVGEEGFDDDEAGADYGGVGFDDGPDDGCIDGPFWGGLVWFFGMGGVGLSLQVTSLLVKNKVLYRMQLDTQALHPLLDVFGCRCKDPHLQATEQK